MGGPQGPPCRRVPARTVASSARVRPPSASIATRGDSGRSGVRDRQMRRHTRAEPRCVHSLERAVWALPCAVAHAQRQWCAGPRGEQRASMRPAMITHAFAWESTMASTRMAARGARDGVVVLSAQSRRGQECGIMIQLYDRTCFLYDISCIEFRASIGTCHFYSI